MAEPVGRLDGLWHRDRWRTRVIPPDLRRGPLAAVLVAIILGVALAIPAARDAFDRADIGDISMAQRVGVGLFRIPFGTALPEEVLFRGVLLGILLRRTTVGRAMVISAGLFGLWHIVPTAEGGAGGMSVFGEVIGTVAAASLAGVAFAWLRQRANSVFAPVVAHTATNSLAYLAAAIALRY